MRDDLLLIKAHFFCFFAALGPILPFISVIGKQLGVSEVAMGMIYAIVPAFYFPAKILFGFMMDCFVRQRTFIFTTTVYLMGLFYLLIYFVPHIPLQKKSLTHDVTCLSTLFCDLHKHDSPNWTVNQVCSMSCKNGIEENNVELTLIPQICENIETKNAECSNVSRVNCSINCEYLSPVSFEPLGGLYKSMHFWLFCLLISLGLIGFNIINTASDTICFNALGDGNEGKYGNQRLWGTVGYGITAFLAGYYIDHLSKGMNTKNNTPAFVLLMFFISLDIIVCSKLKMVPIPSVHHIAKDTWYILKKPPFLIFIMFTLFIGMLDGFAVYYLFWYMESVATETGLFHKIRLIEGLTVLLQSFGGELLIFPLSGKIINKIGYEKTFAFCFLFYAIRFCALSFIPNPWWVLPIETVFHGLTFAFTYSVIVGYASSLSNSAIRGTMQGIVTGLFDGLGYSCGSLTGGLLSMYFSLRIILRILSGFALVSGILYFLLYLFYLKKNICITIKSTEHKRFDVYGEKHWRPEVDFQRNNKF